MADSQSSNQENMVTAPEAPAKKKGHPRGFTLLFLIEMWERFGYYGMFGVLVLYVTKSLGFTDAEAVTLSTAFSGLMYLLVAVGGWLADKKLGLKRMMLLGVIFLIVGYALIAYSSIAGAVPLYLGLGFVSVGGGYFKSCPGAILPQFYEKDDPRLDGAFTLYYMSINIGSLISMALIPAVQALAGWGIALSLNCAFLFIAVAVFFLGRSEFKGKGSRPDLEPRNTPLLIGVAVAGIAVAIIIAFLLNLKTITNIIMAAVVICTLVAFAVLAGRQKGRVRSCMLVALVLIIEAVFFFVLYNQMATSINLFAIHNVECNVFGFEFQAVQLQLLNPLWVLILSPILAQFYDRVGDRFPLIYRFSVGMLVCAVAFALLFVSTLFANSDYLVSPWWLFLSYLFQSMGELMISGLGLSLLTKLVPANMRGFTLGTWYTAQAGASIVSGFIANIASVDASATAAVSLDAYGTVFLGIAAGAFIVGIIMVLIAGKLQRIAFPQSE